MNASGRPQNNELSPDIDLWDRLAASIAKLRAGADRKSDPTALAERLQARAKSLRGRINQPGSAEETLPILAFRKGGGRFGIPLGDVLEVQALDHFVPVPKTPAYLPGVVHWRGAVLALLDIGRLLGVPETGIADVHICIVVEAAARRMAIVALEVEELVSIPLSHIKPPPANPIDVPDDWIIGVHDQNRFILHMGNLLKSSRLRDWQ